MEGSWDSRKRLLSERFFLSLCVELLHDCVTVRQAVRNAGVTDAELRQVTDAQRSEEKEEISRLQVMMEEEQVKHEQEVQRLERELKETEARFGNGAFQMCICLHIFVYFVGRRKRGERDKGAGLSA